VISFGVCFFLHQLDVTMVTAELVCAGLALRWTTAWMGQQRKWAADAIIDVLTLGFCCFSGCCNGVARPAASGRGCGVIVWDNSSWWRFWLVQNCTVKLYNTPYL
jgi:hypothetical protein